MNRSASTDDKKVKPGPYGIGRCEYRECGQLFPKNKTFQRFCTTNFKGQCRQFAWMEEMRKRSDFYLKAKARK